MKGVSQVISALLLLGISVSLVSLYGSWVPGFAQDISGDAANRASEDLSCRNAEISIRDPLYDLNGDRLEFDLENSGTIRFTGTIRAVAFNGSLPIANETIDSLDVTEQKSVLIDVPLKPNRIYVSPVDECQSIKEITSRIEERE